MTPGRDASEQTSQHDQMHLVPQVGNLEAGRSHMSLADQLWLELDRRLPTGSARIQTLLFVGFAAEGLASLLEACVRMHPELEVSNDQLEVLGTTDAGRFDCLMVNHDAFDDPVTAVDVYLAFRKRVPDKIVILVSSEVGGDDLGHDRTAICDATLQFPVSSERFRRGLQAAVENRKALLSLREETQL
jgi:hypothetical protein